MSKISKNLDTHNDQSSRNFCCYSLLGVHGPRPLKVSQYEEIPSVTAGMKKKKIWINMKKYSNIWNMKIWYLFIYLCTAASKKMLKW
jgi:hypothetical protein